MTKTKTKTEAAAASETAAASARTEAASPPASPASPVPAAPPAASTPSVEPTATGDLPIPRLLLAMTSLEAVVLFGSGTGLAFQPELTARWWPWPDLTLFNSRFLGAIYLTSLVAVGCLLATRRWSPARVVVPMIGVFTLCVIVVSTAYLSRFAAVAERPLPVVGWFVLYVALPACAFWYLWQLRGREQGRPAGVATPPAWRYWLRLFAALMAGQAAALLVAPEQVTAFWPWAVDSFHGRMYAATFLAGGVGAWLVSSRATRVELFTVGLSQVSLGLLAIGGALLVEADTGRVEWTAGGTVAWLAIMAGGAASGLSVVARSRSRSLTSAPVEPAATPPGTGHL